MTAAVAAPGERVMRDRLAAWCGWVMVGGAVLTPLVGWLSPLGFTPLVALMGLLCLPAVRLDDADRPAIIVLAGALVWAAVSTLWTPPAAKGADGTALQLALSLPLFWSAICGARRADPRLNALASRVLAWGLAAFGAVLLVEVATDAGIYRTLYDAAYAAPIRPDLARSKDAHATFALAVLWPVALVGGLGGLARLASLALAAAGGVVAAHAFLSDAPVLALPLSAAAMLAVRFWPRLAPRLLAGGIAAGWFVMPAAVWLLRESGDYGHVERDVQTSWSARLDYWSHALDGILARPAHGWGLDASRVLPGMDLHPHNGALQVWLELGVVGAVAAAAFWGLALTRLERDRPSLPAVGLAGSAVTYTLFCWINFGMWQQWWLALGALTAVLAAMHENRQAGSTRQGEKGTG
jgi:O-antigen ligase